MTASTGDSTPDPFADLLLVTATLRDYMSNLPGQHWSSDDAPDLALAVLNELRDAGTQQALVASQAAEITELDRAVSEEIGNRDELNDKLDELAYTIAPIEVIGEHTSANDPWANALQVVMKAQAKAQAAEIAQRVVPSDLDVDALMRCIGFSDETEREQYLAHACEKLLRALGVCAGNCGDRSCGACYPSEVPF